MLINTLILLILMLDIKLLGREKQTDKNDITEIFKIDRQKTIEIIMLIGVGFFAEGLTVKILIVFLILTIGATLGTLRKVEK